MSALLGEVLQNHKPERWDDGNYLNVRYRTIPITSISHPDEYNNVLCEFPATLRTKVTGVNRVQNPYMYGRFVLRAEQLQVKGCNVFEVRRYHPILTIDENHVKEYNCDYRRYNSAVDCQYQNKRPLFYKNPQEAAQDLFESTAQSEMSLVVVKITTTSDTNQSRCTRDWDTEYYPDYIVNLHY